ncbi:MAG: galactose ABC transporter substrate-binding protein [Eubacteriales bacterium]|nr:galactose ABC transporter substrate-binding protein [Eubacteriales bacterium]
MGCKRFACAVCALVMVLASLPFFGCSSSAPEQKPSISVGVAIYNGDDTFISNMMQSLTEIATKYEQDTGIRVYVNLTDAQENQTNQNKQIDRFVSMNYDVLCVNLVDRTDASYTIDRAMDADIPVVFFNREPVQEDLQKWDRVYYVGTDPAENGRLEGQIVVDAYRADPARFDKNGDGIVQYIIIEGEIRHQDAMIRTEVSVQTLKDAGIELEKLDGGIASWVRSQAAALSDQYFEKYGDQIELIICNNDDMALGVIDTVERRGLSFNNIVGIDGTPAGLAAVEQGKMLGTVVIDYAAQAKLIFDLASALAVDGDPGAVTTIGADRTVRAPMYVVKADFIP